MSGEVIDRDLGWEKILKEVGSYREAYTKVGIQGTQAGLDHEGVSNVELATIHEYGCKMTVTPAQSRWMGANLGLAKPAGSTLEIPARSFVRASIDGERTKYDGQSAKLAGRVLEGKMSFRQAMAILGRVISSGMQRFVKSGRVKPPLAPVTIERKNSTQPLVDTGQLVNSITHAEVVR